ncbi:glycosyltransferase, partial [bacterium]|nr:glycosyltransferase [bacterium]
MRLEQPFQADFDQGVGVLSPEISVIMPVHNGEKYLHGAVHSILNQSFSNFEFIIVDDGSTDHSSRIIHSFDDRRIRLISNGKKLGLTASLNKAMVCAKGKFIARMDSDDVSMPERLECQKNFMMQHPEIGVLGTGYQLIDPDGVPGMKKRFPSSSAVIKWRLCFENPIIHSTVMMRRDALA